MGEDGVDSAAVSAAMDAADAAAAGGGDGGTAAPTVDPVEQAVMEALSGLSNVVQDGSGGGWTTGAGIPLGSAGLNISLGLAPNTPALFAPQAQVQNQTALSTALNAAGGPANLTGFLSPEDINVALGYDITPQSMMDLMGVTAATVTAPTLGVLVNAGYGNVEGLNPNNPTQSVAEMLAAQNVANNLPMAFNFMVPGLGTAMNVAKNAVESFGGLQSGSMTPGQALGNLGLAAFGFGNNAFNQGPAIGNMTTGQAATTIGLSALANQLGIPGGASMLGNILEGNFGPVAGGLAAGLANQAVGQATGLGPLAGLAMQATGISPAIGKAVAEAVPSAPQGTGLLSAISNMFDQGTAGAPTGSTSITIPTGDAAPYFENFTPAPAPVTTPKVQEASPIVQRLIYGTQQGPYGPLFRYDIGD